MTYILHHPLLEPARIQQIPQGNPLLDQYPTDEDQPQHSTLKPRPPSLFHTQSPCGHRSWRAAVRVHQHDDLCAAVDSGEEYCLADEDGVDGDGLLAGRWGIDGGETPGRDVEA